MVAPSFAFCCQLVLALFALFCKVGRMVAPSFAFCCQLVLALFALFCKVGRMVAPSFAFCCQLVLALFALFCKVGRMVAPSFAFCCRLVLALFALFCKVGRIVAPSFAFCCRLMVPLFALFCKVGRMVASSFAFCCRLMVPLFAFWCQHVVTLLALCYQAGQMIATSSCCQHMVALSGFGFQKLKLQLTRLWNTLYQRTVRQRYSSNPIQASTSCNAREMEYFQPSFSASFIQNTFREVENQPTVQVLQNGSFVWRIAEVSRYRQIAAAIRSPLLLTAQNGYKMCIEAFLNGSGTGYKSHLSLSFILMKGDYDPLLKWPFNHMVTFVLVDQTKHRHIWGRFRPDCSKPAFQRPQSDSNIPYDLPQFAELFVLDDTRYVKEDVMYIKFMVDTTN